VIQDADDDRRWSRLR